MRHTQEFELSSRLHH